MPNLARRIGEGILDGSSLPRVVINLSSASAVPTTNNHTFALITYETARCCGENQYGVAGW